MGVAIHLLPRSAFPLLIEFLAADGRVVHAMTIAGSGIVEVPALAKLFGPVSARITFADGVVIHSDE